jgi:hypothetical protein
MIRYDTVRYRMPRYDKVCHDTVSFFFVSPATVGLSHRTPAFAGISPDTCLAQDNYKRNARYNIKIRFGIRTVSYSLDHSLPVPNVVQVPMFL